MSAALLDVNLLIALAWPSHVHHGEAQAWFADHASKGWATCALTQCAFVRISSNPRIIPEAVTPKEAMGLLAEVVGRETHRFWPDDICLTHEDYPSDLLVGHRQVTDAYLLGLAIHHGGRLVTLDAGLSELLPTGNPHHDVLQVIDLTAGR